MGYNPSALFSCLLDDIAPVLGDTIIERIKAGKEVLPWLGISPKEFACVALSKSFYKKYVDMVERDSDKRALEKFLAVNASCSSWANNCNTSWDEILLGELKRSLHNFWFLDGLTSLIEEDSQIWEELRCGPGASLNALSYDFYSKLFSSPLSVTDGNIYRSYRNYIASNPKWSAAESFRADNYGSAYIVEGNRLSFVPKQRDISRIICIEPTLNMSGQLGIGELLSRRLRQVYGIDLSKQPDRNKELARLGSIDGSFATIDLSSASDSMSMRMLEEVLPPDFFWWLCQFRSPSAQLPDGSRVELKMISTMGNGFTFPLQTILFSCIVSAAARANAVKLWWPRGDDLGNVGVFGDDIIIPTGVHYSSRADGNICEVYNDKLLRDVLRLLELLGFKINVERPSMRVLSASLVVVISSTDHMFVASILGR